MKQRTYLKSETHVGSTNDCSIYSVYSVQVAPQTLRINGKNCQEKLCRVEARHPRCGSTPKVYQRLYPRLILKPRLTSSAHPSPNFHRGGGGGWKCA